VLLCCVVLCVQQSLPERILHFGFDFEFAAGRHRLCGVAARAAAAAPTPASRQIRNVLQNLVTPPPPPLPFPLPFAVVWCGRLCCAVPCCAVAPFAHVFCVVNCMCTRGAARLCCREQNAEGEKAHLLRFAKLLLGLLIIIHWLGCVYIALGYLRGFNSEWLPEPDVKEMAMSSQYLYGISWSANILTGVGGEPERPTNDLERVVTLLITLIAMFVVAIIIGNVSELVSEANVNDEKFRQKVSGGRRESALHFTHSLTHSLTHCWQPIYRWMRSICLCATVVWTKSCKRAFEITTPIFGAEREDSTTPPSSVCVWFCAWPTPCLWWT
jgi:hypothetical protein